MGRNSRADRKEVRATLASRLTPEQRKSMKSETKKKEGTGGTRGEKQRGKRGGVGVTVGLGAPMKTKGEAEGARGGAEESKKIGDNGGSCKREGALRRESVGAACGVLKARKEATTCLRNAHSIEEAKARMHVHKAEESMY